MRDSAPSRRMLRAAAPAARTGSVLKKTVAAGAVLGSPQQRTATLLS